MGGRIRLVCGTFEKDKTSLCLSFRLRFFFWVVVLRSVLSVCLSAQPFVYRSVYLSIYLFVAV